MQIVEQLKMCKGQLALMPPRLMVTTLRLTYVVVVNTKELKIFKGGTPLRQKNKNFSRLYYLHSLSWIIGWLNLSYVNSDKELPFLAS